jgi:hypothetical protein
MEDYDCTSPGTVWYRTVLVLYRTRRLYRTVRLYFPYDRTVLYRTVRDILLFLFFTICPRFTAVIGRCSQPTNVVHIYNLPS